MEKTNDQTTTDGATNLEDECDRECCRYGGRPPALAPGGGEALLGLGVSNEVALATLGLGRPSLCLDGFHVILMGERSSR